MANPDLNAEYDRRGFLKISGAAIAVAGSGTALAQLAASDDYEDVAWLIGPRANRPPPSDLDDYDAGHWVYWTTDDSGRYELEAGDASWSVLPGSRNRLIASLTEDVTVSNTMDETTVFESTIEADHFLVHDVYELEASGAYTTTNSSETFTLRFYLGSTQLAAITSVADNADTYSWSATLRFTVRAIDGDGVLKPHTKAVFNNVHDDQHHGTVTLDTTIAERFSVTVQWDEANASNEVLVGQGILERLGTAG